MVSGTALEATRVVLAGVMGSGKSSVGRLLAAELEARFVDLDEQIEREAGCSITDIFEREGETGFRARERACLTSALALEGSWVLAAGGGALLSDEALAAVKQRARLVTLRASPETVAERMTSAHERTRRPLLSGTDVAARTRALLQQRARWYAEGDLHVDTDGRSPAEVAEVVLAYLRGPR